MANNLEKVVIPDIGGATDVDVIELLVKVGDKIEKDTPLITLEGDKATMEVPSPIAGVVKKIAVKVGDKVSEGSLILEAETSEKGESETAEKTKKPEKAEETKKAEKTEKAEKPKEESKPAAKNHEEEEEEETETSESDVHAGPGVRRLAREFGIDLKQVNRSGQKGRILKEDLQEYVKKRLSESKTGGGFSFPPIPAIDFNKFGETETRALTRIQKISGANLHRNWVTIPHITQFGEADITKLENFRQQQKSIVESQGVKLTPLVFVMKAVVAALKEYPHFNASLDPNGEQLILKKYFHLGVAVDTPNGLVVPVIRDVDQKGIVDLAKELAAISEKARETGLGMNDMQGGCFTISSLGGIGGTAFTPIINAPEVAILGVSRTATKPVYEEGVWLPRLMLPLSLSYDHRVIDGADGARFMTFLTSRLADIRTLLL